MERQGGERRKGRKEEERRGREEREGCTGILCTPHLHGPRKWDMELLLSSVWSRHGD